jgi:hypothetical protein
VVGAKALDGATEAGACRAAAAFSKIWFSQ